MEHSTSAVNWQPLNLAKLPGRDDARLPGPRRPRRRRASGSSSGGRRGPARRSSTPAWCRTPAPTPGCGARWSSSARRSTPSTRSPAAGPRNEVASSSTTRRGGAASSTPTPASTSATSTGPRPAPRAARAQGSASTSCTRAPTCRLPARRGPHPLPRHRRAPRPPSPRRPRPGRPCWSPTSPASSTSTTTSGSAATPARSATCSACGSRSSCRCSRASGAGRGSGRRHRRADTGPRTSTWPAPRRSRRTPTGRLPGRPAVTRRAGRAPARPGTSRTRLDAAGTACSSSGCVAEAGVRRLPGAAAAGRGHPPRRATDASWLFVLNHSDDDAQVPVHGTDLVAGREVGRRPAPAAGGVAVVREATSAREA